ncbi:unnamed protein product [Didymodactylos carnosus]|uniref:WASH1 WAHD domain-containing protein n=1 Tax=Didymodactylos carnosus TaxID=1234261 RepID=A0A814MAZ7_9BILA|nr:unnamed protein product [Didymodactylos carnosus]CAF1075590.1 unnamed protein product [Didymodactylos carnosus]CAF3627302.1 unnamed protein product [Didymodactylos carnosus]CAF3842171.1 unnamed protein product [Didymodactylos carnosus]
MEYLYGVPVISTELRRAEFAKQLADVFDYMDQISLDMFNRITIRLNLYRQQLNKFDEKINNANVHIERIRQSKRATQIHSSSHYPVEQKRSVYKSIFIDDESTANNDEHGLSLQWNTFKLSENEKFYDINDKDSRTKDETLIVLKPTDDSNSIRKTKTNKLHGLGKPSTNIKSVLSFLKYNTQENPYTQSTRIDPLSIAGKMRKNTEEHSQSRIGETPLPAFYHSISAGGEIGYIPVLGPVPTLTLPENLDELPNFATDMAQDWAMESIAPSSSSLLPDVRDLAFSSGATTNTQVSAPPTVSDLPAIVPLTQSTIPPPPPPPPPSFSVESTINNVPTPQPPPLPPTAFDSNELETENKGNRTQSITENTSSGNPLLDAIQNFKKDNLRNAQEKKLSKRAEEEAKDAPDLLKNLQIQLQKRRYFMVGEPEEPKKSKKSTNMAGEIGDMIDVIRKEKTKESEDDDEDWEQ